MSTAGLTTLPLKPRQQHLLQVAEANGGRWTTKRVRLLYSVDYPGVTQRGTARRDLDRLVALGRLTPHGPDDGRFYLLADTKGGTR